MNSMNMVLARQKNHGFTLTELLVVVAVIAILSTVALPIYKKSVIKTEIGTMWHAAEAAKLAVTSDFYRFYTYATSNYANNSYDFTTANNDCISSIAIASGVITINGASSCFPGLNIQLFWTPSINANSDLVWTCSFSSDAANYISSNYCQL